jgi:hypothetical protein
VGIRGLVPLSSIAVLVLSGCGASIGPGPEASCAPRLLVGGELYRPFDGDLMVISVDGEPDIAAGDPVPDAAYAGCDDGGGLTGGGPTDAWRVADYDRDLLLTLTACARLEGTEGAADCDPKASRYMIWEPDVALSSAPS